MNLVDFLGQVPLSFREDHATVLLLEDSESPENLREALGIFEEVHGITRREFGPQHPRTQLLQAKVEFCRRCKATGHVPRK